jgi:hypothetical protein
MKQNVTPALKAFLLSVGSRQIQFADCLTITLLTGQVYRFTSFDVDVYIGIRLFTSMGSRFKRGKIESKRGVETSTLDINLIADNSNDLTGGQLSSPPQNVGLLSFTQAAVAGLLYQAQVELETVYEPVRNPDGSFSDNAWGSLIKFVGFIGQVSAYRESIDIEADSNLHLLEPQWPYFIAQPSCKWRVFDNGCTLNPASFAVAGTCLAGGSPTQVISALTNPSGYFQLGRIVFTSGNNNGLSRQIYSSLGAGASLNYPTTVLNDKPVLYLQLNDAVGSPSAADSSGGGHNASVHGGITFGRPSLIIGGTGTGALFDGSTGYLTDGLPRPSNYRAGCSFEFWYSLTSGAAAGQPVGIFDTNPGTGTTQPYAWRNNYSPRDTGPGFEWYPDTPFVGFDAPATNTPTHVVVVFRGSNMIDFYQNGQYVETIGAAGGGLANFAAAWAIGRSGLGLTGPNAYRYLDATLQHFAVYNYALPPNKVLTHYTAGITAPGSNVNALMILTDALPYAPAAGDAFNAYPGCDRTLITCQDTFNNIINFSGVPFIPVPEQGA